MSKTINLIREYDLEKVIRPSYGAASLLAWKPTFVKFLGKLDIMQKYWENVDPVSNGQVQSALDNILGHLKQISTLSDAQFVSGKDNFISQIAQQMIVIKQHYPNYIAEAIDESGILADMDFNDRIFAVTENLKKITEDALLKIKTESDKIIENANLKAEEIETVVRKTATNISVEAAQDQFRDAANENKKNINIWGGINISLIAIFILSIFFMLVYEPSDPWTWKVIYYSALRIAILGFIGTLLAFSLRILRSHLHMREHNLHRKRIANSMAAFAESATSKEQRDLILSRLVDSVATFGNSGMISNDDDGNSKITIDNITRTLSAFKSSGS